MFKKIFLYVQYLLPQHFLSAVIGSLANCRWRWLKNGFIAFIVHTYHIDMSSALIEYPYSYSTFNDFFTRPFKPTARPFQQNSQHILSPVDGYLIQQGSIQRNQLIQAKGKYFTLENLLGGDQQSAQLFEEGSYAIFYLAPHNYHRVYMPVSAQLTQHIFIPGKLFSVNRSTTTLIPNLFARNERIVTLFDTALGPMSVILVGALIVGSIETVWEKNLRASHITQKKFARESAPKLHQGEEIGLFKMGSTVILLFGKNKITWKSQKKENPTVEMGQILGWAIPEQNI